MALCLFPLVLVVPGWAVAQRANLFDFGRRSVPGKLGIALVLSISIVPALTYLMARLASLKGACLAWGLLALIIVVPGTYRMIRARQIPAFTSIFSTPDMRQLMGGIVAWIVLATLLLTDLEVSERLYPAVLSHDYAIRVAVTSAISRTGVPPVNPSFYPGEPMELHYYYFWFLTCSVIDVLGGTWVSARAALHAGTVWLGVALVALIVLFTKMAPIWRLGGSRAPMYVAPALLLVTGFDIVPIAGKYLYHGLEGNVILYPSADWWNEAVATWLPAILWVPHHVAGLITTLTVLLLLLAAGPGPLSRPLEMTLVPLSAVVLLSSLGLSVWMTFAVAVYWAVWLVVVWRKGWYGDVRRMMLIGGLAFILAMPYLLDLRRANLTAITPVVVSVRTFLPLHTLLMDHGASSGVLQMADFAALPVNYFMEFGFFGIAGALYWRRRLNVDRPLDRHELALVVLTFCVIAVASVLRSNIAYNDLGWRSVLFVQFVLLLWGAEIVWQLVRDWRQPLERFRTFSRGTRRVLAVSLLVGLLPLVYDAVMMKLYAAAGDLRLGAARAHGFLNEEQLGRRYHDFRHAYAWINEHLPETAVVQHNPDVLIDVPSGLYANRQAAVSDRLYGTLFGIPFSMYEPVFTSLSAVFSSETVSRRDVLEACREYGIDIFMVKDTDPVWYVQDSWMSDEQPLFENRSARILPCPNGEYP